MCVCAYLVWIVYWLRKRQIKYKNFFFVYPSTNAQCFSPTQMHAHTDKHFHLCSHSQLCTPAVRSVPLSLPPARTVHLSLSVCLSMCIRFLLLLPIRFIICYPWLWQFRHGVQQTMCVRVYVVHFDVSIHSRRWGKKRGRRSSSKNNLYYHLIQTLP